MGINIVVVSFLTIIPFITLAIYKWGIEVFTIKGAEMFRNLVMYITLLGGGLLFTCHSYFDIDLKKELIKGRIIKREMLTSDDDGREGNVQFESFKAREKDADKEGIIDLWILFVIVGSPYISILSANKIKKIVQQEFDKKHLNENTNSY